MRWLLYLGLSFFGMAIGAGADDGTGAAIGALWGLMIARFFVERSRRHKHDEDLRLLRGDIESLSGYIGELRRSVSDLRAAVIDPGAERGETGPSARRSIEAPVATRVASAPAAAATPTAPTGAESGSLAEPTAAQRPVTPPQGVVAAPETPRPTDVRVAAAPRVDLGPPPSPPPPSQLDEALGAIRQWLFGGNILVRVGVIVLLFGAAFVAKYAADNDYFPIEARLALTALFGLGLVGIGFRLRHQRAGFAVSLQGGGIGILYIVVTAAFRLYELIPQTFAFAAFVTLAAVGVVLALAQSTQALAVLATAGGFLAPILASTGGGSHIVLFSYYALLNGAILAVAYKRAWRVLNLVGFFFTFGVGASWGVDRYRPEFLLSCELFLGLFVVIYIGLVIAFAARHPAPRRGFVDGTIVFGTPLAAFGMQAGLMRDVELGLGLSAVGLAFVYAGLAFVLLRVGHNVLRHLVEGFAALGISFTVLALPLSLDARWTSAGWALQGAALVWIGVRQERRLARWFGAALVFASAISWAASDAHPGDGLPLINPFGLGALLIALAGYFVHERLRRGNTFDRILSVAAVALGLGFWLLPAWADLDARLSLAWEWTAVAGLFAGSALLHELVGKRLGLVVFRWAAVHMLAVVAFIAVAWGVDHTRPSARGGWALWPASIALWVWLIHRLRDGLPKVVREALAAVGVWLLTLLIATELSYWAHQLAERRGEWNIAAALLGPIVVLAGIRLAESHGRLGVLRNAVILAGALPIAALTLFVVGPLLLGSSATPTPLPYIPFFNPLELAQWAALVGALHTLVRGRALLRLGDDTWLAVAIGLGVTAGLIVTAGVARTVHVLEGVPYAADYLFASVIFQAALSLTWSVLALVLMGLGVRRKSRVLWFSGVVPLGLVVIKLFLVDLSGQGTLARIISFVGVGVLVVLVGYLAPVPPRAQKSQESS